MPLAAATLAALRPARALSSSSVPSLRIATKHPLFWFATVFGLTLPLFGCVPDANDESTGVDAAATQSIPVDTSSHMMSSTEIVTAGAIGRTSTLGPFLGAHWRLPIPLQDEAPSGFSEVEASLDPAVCGACHPKQYADWQTSLHAGAFSPGFSGQLIEGELAAPNQVRQCQTCHTPLGEQQPFGPDLAAEPAFDPALRKHGIVCAGCHVRSHQRFGPPRRPELPKLAEELPHAGFEARTEYTESRFCAPCHQFFDDPGINGKPIENTFAEWRASPQAAEGRSCQSCHMPDRAHLWRGIHDPEMVRSAVATELVAIDLASEILQAALVLESREVGHAFPTYVTPRVYLAVWQEGNGGVSIAGTNVDAVIGREVDFGNGIEVFDTRVMPGESVKLDYVQARRPGAVALVGRVTVDPDYHYRGVFDYLLATLTDPEARARIQEAQRRASASSYALAEFRLALPESSPE